MTSPADAAKVLAKCACYDPMFSRPDPVLAAGWAEAFTVYSLELPDLLAAVTKHYIESADRAMPSHLIRLAREIRRDRGQRESADERRVRESELDQRLMDKIRAVAQRKAVSA
jgi:hypothetical protein